MLVDDADQSRQIPPDLSRLHVPGFSHGDIDAIEADFRSSFGEGFALQELEVLGKDADFQAVGRRAGEGDAITKPAAAANKLRLEISGRPNVRCIMTSDFLRNDKLFAVVRHQELVVHRIVGESLRFAVEGE